MKTIAVENVDYSILTPIASNGVPTILMCLSHDTVKMEKERNKTGPSLKIETTDSSLETFMMTLNTIQSEIDQLLNIQ